MYMKIGKCPQFTVFSYLLTLSIYSDVHENWQIFPLHKFTIGLKVHCWPRFARPTMKKLLVMVTEKKIRQINS